MWKTLKTLCPNVSTPDPDFVIKDGVKLDKANDIANTFNNFFCEIGSKLADNFDSNGNVRHDIDVSSVFYFCEITPQFVCDQLRTLKLGKATGLDSISSRLLKAACNIVCIPLSVIMNMSLCTGKIPSDWKHARVTPIFKNGSRHEIGNYRPISVLPVIMKVFERAIHTRLYQYFTVNNLLTSCQSGFRAQHSTVSTLLSVTNKMFKYFDEGKCVGALFLDLKKAFDTVNHKVLLKKLSLYGVTELPLSWFNSYLSERTQCTQFCGVLSDSKQLVCGVSQGSILGPLLFVIYINDIVNAVHKCDISLYADDTALFYASSDPLVMSQVLNEEMVSLSKWFYNNQLTLNVQKTNVMILGLSKRLQNFSHLNISIDGIDLNRVDRCKYLGIILDQHLSFYDHINYISGKIRQKLGIFARCRKYISQDTALTLYKSLILPHFDYCDQVWDTCTLKQQDHLQILQNRALRTIVRAPQRTHIPDLHKQCQLTTLQERRTFHLATTIYKVMNGLMPSYLLDLLQTPQHNHRTRHIQSNNLSLPRCRLETGKKAFAYRAPKLFNSLPQYVRQASNLGWLRSRNYTEIISLRKPILLS